MRSTLVIRELLIGVLLAVAVSAATVAPLLLRVYCR